uniref:NB-ARC domain-containing protein n=1 Tax=Rhizophora mucronata TaxID=61149 RepID=A0A2P2NH97_RHIMU
MEVLTEKKFFLVLDDVWNKDYIEWKDLQKPLMFGKKGSKILVTSRNQDVANCIKTSPIH